MMVVVAEEFFADLGDAVYALRALDGYLWRFIWM